MNDILSVTKHLLTFQSTHDNLDAKIEILKYVEELLAGQTFTSFVSSGIPSLLYTNHPDERAQFKILLNAHLDVVPAPKEMFTAYEKDGKLYGRGVYDMKAAAAAMILLFKELGDNLSYPLGLQLTTDEETIGFYGTDYQLKQGITADFAITGECGSNLRITNQLRGLLVVKLTASGKEAHAGHLWHGENALLKLYEAINILIKQYPTPEKATWQTTVNLANITTENITHNVVPASATAILDIRPIPAEAENILEKVKALLPEDINLEVVKSMPGLETPKSNPYVKTLLDAITNTTKNPGELAQSYAGSDIIFYAMHNIPGIEFGPIGAGQHTNEEWVDIQSLESYYQTLKSFLLSIK